MANEASVPGLAPCKTTVYVVPRDGIVVLTKEADEAANAAVSVQADAIGENPVGQRIIVDDHTVYAHEIAYWINCGELPCQILDCERAWQCGIAAGKVPCPDRHTTSRGPVCLKCGAEGSWDGDLNHGDPEYAHAEGLHMIPAILVMATTKIRMV